MKKTWVLFLLSCLLTSTGISGQDVIYRKDGEVIVARVIDKTSRYCIYRMDNETEPFRNFISTALIDSIRFEDGHVDIFEKQEAVTWKNNLKTSGLADRGTEPGHHLVGFDVMGLLYNNLRFSYEFLPGKAHIGFRAVYARNFDPETNWNGSIEPDYGNISLQSEWHSLVGINIYFLPPRTFRVGTGLHYCFGSCILGEMIYDEPTNTNTPVYENKSLHGIIWSFLLFSKFQRNLAMNVGLDVPLYVDPSFSNVMFRGEILINF